MSVARPKNYRGARQNAAREHAKAPLLKDEAVILAGVREALLHYGGALERWTALAKKGATDDEVRDHIRRSLGEHGYSGGPGQPCVHHWGGARPRVVIEEPERRGRRAPRKVRTVQGAELLRAARWLFKIAAPGERWRSCVVCGDDIAIVGGKTELHKAPGKKSWCRGSRLPAFSRARPAKRPKKTKPAPERAVAAGGHIKKCLSVDWWTPPELLERVRLVLGDPIPLDPFTAPSNPTGAARFYTLRENGLAQPWDAPWFANPPYGRALRPSLAKIVRESITRHAGCLDPLPGVALLPCSRWEQGYLHDVLRAASVVCFVRKRIKFVKASSGDRVGGTPMASMFLGFNVDVPTFMAALDDVGLCLRTSEI